MPSDLSLQTTTPEKRIQAAPGFRARSPYRLEVDAPAWLHTRLVARAFHLPHLSYCHRLHSWDLTHKCTQQTVRRRIEGQYPRPTSVHVVRVEGKRIRWDLHLTCHPPLDLGQQQASRRSGKTDDVHPETDDDVPVGFTIYVYNYRSLRHPDFFPPHFPSFAFYWPFAVGFVIALLGGLIRW